MRALSHRCLLFPFQGVSHGILAEALEFASSSLSDTTFVFPSPNAKQQTDKLSTPVFIPHRIPRNTINLAFTMSYQPPTDSFSALNPMGSSNPLNPRGGSAAGTMNYLCAECGGKVQLNKGEPIRCKECGHRVLYKQRTKRYVDWYLEMVVILGLGRSARIEGLLKAFVSFDWNWQFLRSEGGECRPKVDLFIGTLLTIAFTEWFNLMRGDFPHQCSLTKERQPSKYNRAPSRQSYSGSLDLGELHSQSAASV